MEEQPTAARTYPVLMPFKRRNAVLKAPLVQLTPDDAAEYLAAGVIGPCVEHPATAPADPLPDHAPAAPAGRKAKK